MAERVTEVEKGVAVIQADLVSVKRTVERVDKMVTNLVESQAEEEKRR